MHFKETIRAHEQNSEDMASNLPAVNWAAALCNAFWRLTTWIWQRLTMNDWCLPLWHNSDDWINATESCIYVYVHFCSYHEQNTPNTMQWDEHRKTSPPSDSMQLITRKQRRWGTNKIQNSEMHIWEYNENMIIRFLIADNCAQSSEDDADGWTDSSPKAAHW